MGKLDGKVAMITGAGGEHGIGRAIATRLAQEGADVVVNDYTANPKESTSLDRGTRPAWAGLPDLVREIEGLGRRALAVEADISETKQIHEMVQQTLKTFGQINILVNNAGGIIRRALLGDLDPELIAQTLQLNFTSVALLCQALVPVMVEQGGGMVINISSIAAHNGGAPTTPHYGPAKAAVSNLARTLTKEFGADNVQVNSVAPGIIDNRFHQDHTPADMFEKLVAGVPLGRAGTNEDVAGAVAFLASPNADYISGEVIHVNGGLYFGQ
mgnify:CR=1 FL=1